MNFSVLLASQACSPAASASETRRIHSSARSVGSHQRGPWSPARLTTALRAFASRSGSWLLSRSERFSPIHGDYRLDNLLFATPAGGSPVATVDWQTLEIGLPGRDLGYFLGNSLSSENRRECERELVAAYHEALVALGVKGHSLEECFDDYRHGQFQGLLVTVVASVMLTHTQRGDAMFMAMSSRACQAIRDLESLDLL